MNDDLLRYDRMVEGALRGVVKSALETARDNGLPGDHHFYITFRTRQSGVQIPDRLREQYPDEMTIVLQYQYDDLIIRDDGFGITLSFNLVPERLEIPYNAITTFADPSVNFALQFQPMEEFDQDEEADGDEGGDEVSQAETVDLSKGEGEAASDATGDNVVTLDAFRKKT